MLADSVGLGLLVVLDTLPPAERLVFVLHDMFAMPFAEVAAVLERSAEAARQLASRARRRVRGVASLDRAADRARQREVAAAFLAASRDGDLSALLALLDSGVTLTADASCDATAGGRDTVTFTSATPPGRLRMRGSQGRRRPARRRRPPDRRALHPHPPRALPAPARRHRLRHLRLHESIHRPVASTAWILARAACALPAATTVTVLYGEQVHALTHPGQAPGRVTDFQAPTSPNSSAGRSTPSTARSACPAPAPPGCWPSSPTPTTPRTNSPAGNGASSAWPRLAAA